MAHWKREFRLDEFGQGCAHPQLEGLVKRDRDGQQFLDIFSPEWGPNFIQWTEFVPAMETIPIDPVEFLKRVFDQIEDGRTKHKNNLKVLAKYEWLATEHYEHAVALGVNSTRPAQTAGSAQ